MTSTDRISDPSGERIFSELGEYQAISRLAVAALVAGVFSALAMLGVLLWMVPLFAIVMSLVALLRIQRAGGALVGRPMALAGLCLGVGFGSAALADYFNSHRIVARQAHALADEWFKALARHQPELAHQWTVGLGNRPDVEDLDRLKGYYESNQKPNEELARFIAQKPIELLLALGSRAHVRWVSNVSIDDPLQLVSQMYEVTYQDAGQPQRFLILLTLERKIILGQLNPWWRVASWSTVGPVPPLPAD